jgi:hypothetical protein
LAVTPAPDGESRIRALREALARDPSLADAQGQLGALLLEQARALQTAAMARRRDRSAEAAPLYRESLAHLRAAARLQPERAQPHRMCGIVLREIGELAAARSAFADAYRIAPEHPGVAADFASALQATGDTAAAAAAYEQALARHPDDATLHAGYALTLLGGGDFARGWEQYEWRLRVADAAIERPFPFPRWRGEPLGGRTLLVYSEQGIGDEIMFASCFGELIGAAAHCVLEASTRLAPLFRRSFPRATVLARDLSRMPDWSTLPAIDLCIAAGSVPRLLRGEASAFPRHSGYLSPEPRRVSYWRERLATLGGGRRIGLAWTGGLPGTLRAARSMALTDLRPLIEPGADAFVALEFLDCGEEVEAFRRAGPGRIHWWPEAVQALDETAAIAAALDLVISVTTATAHLAGALGRPTWVLVPSVPSWRYLWDGATMPWYPTMRIFRGRGSAQAAIRLAAEALRAGRGD